MPRKKPVLTSPDVLADNSAVRVAPAEVAPAVRIAPRTPDSPPPVAAPPPEVPVEKHPAQSVRSVALEFAPDGARDIRVRVAERGGEVRVSLHSADPVITKSLRENATDLASALTHAGYDAETRTFGNRQQRDQQQHQPQWDEPTVRRRDAGGEEFTGVLQQSNQEIS